MGEIIKCFHFQQLCSISSSAGRENNFNQGKSLLCNPLSYFAVKIGTGSFNDKSVVSYGTSLVRGATLVSRDYFSFMASLPISISKVSRPTATQIAIYSRIMSALLLHDWDKTKHCYIGREVGIAMVADLATTLVVVAVTVVVAT
eukprot:1871650-Ditylum_brightwellii.AAC.2